MATLYRKYRPQAFSDVSGQSHIKQTIQNEIKNDKIAHAYLFCGPRGVGKTTMARLVAKAANCLNRKEGEFEPCNNCDSCNEIMEGKALDVVEIDAASHTGVDHVREHIINAARFVPNSRKFKVFIIDEVHMLSTAAFNALLKILEEPPSYVKFVLATTEIHKILPTIISRCQRFDFKKIEINDLKERLERLVAAEGKKVDDDVYSLVIKNADGCLRDAESLLGQVLILDDAHITLEQVRLVLPVTNYVLADELISYIAAQDIPQAITMINRLVQEGINLEQFNRDVIEYTRKIMLYAIHQVFEDFALDLDESLRNQIKEWSGKFSITQLLKMVDVFIKALADQKNSPIIQLPLELAIVTILGQGNTIGVVQAQGGQQVSQVARPAQATVQPPVQQQQSVAAAQESTIQQKASAQPAQTVQQPVQAITQSQNVSEEKANVESEDISTQEVEGQAEPATQQEPKVQQEQNIVYGNSTVTLDGIKQRWSEAKGLIQQENYSLSCVFGAAAPREVQGSKVILVCKHKFGVDKLADVQNKIIIENALSKLHDAKVQIEALIDQNLESVLDDEKTITMGEVLKMSRDTTAQQAADKQSEGQGAQQGTNSQQPTGDDSIDQVLDLFGGSVVG